MANVQKENGFTPIAHELLEATARFKFNGTQLRILLIIWRYTYGFNRKQHPMSISFIAKAIEANDGQVERELKTLIDKNIIFAISKGKRHTRSLEINKHYDTWKSDIFPLIRGKNKEVVETVSTLGLEVSLPANKGEDLPANKGDKKERKKTIKKVEINDMDIPTGKIKFLDTVFLTQNQYDRLIQEFGKEKVDLYIEMVDEWQTNNPKKARVDHNKTLRVWIRRDAAKYPPKNRQQKNDEQMDILNSFYKEGEALETTGDIQVLGSGKDSVPPF